MKTRLLSVLVLALTFSVPLVASPRWTSLGPFGGDVEHLTVDPVDPQVLYATLGVQGTFKSVDRGDSWNPILAGVASSGVAVDPTRHTTIYQAVEPGQVWKSLDGGAHWTISTISCCQQVGEMAVDPAVHTRIYLATNSGGFWYSLDGGASWQSNRQPLPNIRALVALPRPADTVLIGTDGGLFKSADGGASGSLWAGRCVRERSRPWPARRKPGLSGRPSRISESFSARTTASPGARRPHSRRGPGT